MKYVTSIGEILFDIYPHGKKPGGAPFNFIYHIIKLTGKGNFVSRVGDDDLGDEIRDYLYRKQISTEFIQTDKEHKTGVSKTTLDKNKVPEFIIEENRAYDFIELTPDLEKLISEKTDCLYFGTLARRSGKSRDTIQSLFGRKIKYFCDLNIRQEFYSEKIIEKSLSSANVLKLNEDELKLVNKLILNSEFDKAGTAKKILEVFEIDLLCVTRGSEGATIYKGRDENTFNINSRNVVDTVGAGDAYASLLCLGYLKQWKIEKINKLASEFAGEIVKVEGALPHDDNIYETFKKKINDEDG